MSDQNLQIRVMILVINVVMSSIRSSSAFQINVPGVNLNEREVALMKFVEQLLTWPISERSKTRLVSCICNWTAFPYPVPVTREERIRVI